VRKAFEHRGYLPGALDNGATIGTRLEVLSAWVRRETLISVENEVDFFRLNVELFLCHFEALKLGYGGEDGMVSAGCGERVAGSG
jgi:hypothetical protein